MKYPQLSFLSSEKENKISPNSCKCWRCQGYFPASSIHIFSIRDIHGYVSDYQACEACYQVMTKEED